MMKKISLLCLVIFPSMICFSQAFNAKLKIGSKDNIDVLRCSIILETDADGRQTFKASNGSSYKINIKNKSIINQEVIAAGGKQIKLMPISKTATNSKTCHLCLEIKWPGGKTEEICRTVNCEDWQKIAEEGNSF